MIDEHGLKDLSQYVDTGLEDIYSVEDYLLLSRKIDSEIEFMKELKRYRAQAIDNEVAKLKSRSDLIKKVVLKTMEKQEPNKKTVNFPAIAKVTRKKSVDSWRIDDEDDVLNFMEENNKLDEVTKTEVKIKKKELNAALKYYKTQDIKVPGALLQVGYPTLSIAYDKEVDDTIKKKEEGNPGPSPEEPDQSSNPYGLDELDESKL